MFTSLGDKLKDGVGGAFSLDHLQNGDEWMEEEDPGSDADSPSATKSGRQTRNSEKEHGNLESGESPVFANSNAAQQTVPSPTINRKTTTTTTTTTSSLELQSKNAATIAHGASGNFGSYSTESISSATQLVSGESSASASPGGGVAAAAAAAAASSGPTTSSDAATTAKKRVDKAAAAVSRVAAASSFFSLDAMQEDDPWMGAGTQGQLQGKRLLNSGQPQNNHGGVIVVGGGQQGLGGGQEEGVGLDAKQHKDDFHNRGWARNVVVGGFDEDEDGDDDEDDEHSSVGDEIDGTLLSGRRGRLYAAGAFDDGSSPLGSAAAVAAAAAGENGHGNNHRFGAGGGGAGLGAFDPQQQQQQQFQQLDARSFAARQQALERQTDNLTEVSLDDDDAGGGGGGDGGGAGNAGNAGYGPDNTAMRYDLRHQNAPASLLGTSFAGDGEGGDSDGWASPPPKPMRPLFQGEDEGTQKEAMLAAARANFATPRNPYLSGLEMDAHRSKRGDEVARTLQRMHSEDEDREDGGVGKHSWLNRASQRRDDSHAGGVNGGNNGQQQQQQQQQQALLAAGMGHSPWEYSQMMQQQMMAAAARGMPGGMLMVPPPGYAGVGGDGQPMPPSASSSSSFANGVSQMLANGQQQVVKGLAAAAYHPPWGAEDRMTAAAHDQSNRLLRQQKAAATDHFGVLLQREKLGLAGVAQQHGGGGLGGGLGLGLPVSTAAGFSAVAAELSEGRLPRLSTVHRFQVLVVLLGGGLAYFYYTMRSYFVLT